MPYSDEFATIWCSKRGVSMAIELFRAFFIIFVAEMGDKSQILAMTFATKYKLRQVMIGVFLGILLNHTIAVFFGSQLQTFIKPLQMNLVVGVIFLLFGFWSFYNSPDDEKRTVQKFGPILTISIAFFLGELGDKTQFAAIALSGEATYPWLILVSTVSAMMATSLLGIYAGIRFGQKIPDFYLRILSTLVFVVYGTFKLSISNLPVWNPNIALSLFVLIGIAYMALLWVSIHHYQKTVVTAFQQAAQTLQDYYKKMETSLNVLCLGESICGSCLDQQCLIGHTKYLIEEAKHGRPVDSSYLESKVVRDVNIQKVWDALQLTLNELENHWDDEHYHAVHQIRKNIEFILFQKNVKDDSYLTYVEHIEEMKKRING